MDIQYIAGFFDGEGTIAIQRNRVRISIPQTDENILNKIRDYLGVGKVSIVKKRKEHWKDCWMYWTGSNIDALTVLDKLDGHLIIKQKKLEDAKLVLENFYDTKEGRKNKLTKALKLVRAGKSYREAETLTGISRQTICNHIH